MRSLANCLASYSRNHSVYAEPRMIPEGEGIITLLRALIPSKKRPLKVPDIRLERPPTEKF